MPDAGQYRWTEERKEIAKKMWLDGSSSGQIASALGITRNAAIGIVYRMGLSRGPNLHRYKVKRMIAPRNPGASASLKTPRENKFKQPSAVQQLFQRVPMPPAEELVIPPGQAKTLLELEPHHCRWPLWKFESDPKHYCGGTKAAGTSYCIDHCRVAFAPSSTRQRAPDAPVAPIRNNAKEFAL